MRWIDLSSRSGGNQTNQGKAPSATLKDEEALFELSVLVHRSMGSSLLRSHPAEEVPTTTNKESKNLSIHPSAVRQAQRKCLN